MSDNITEDRPVVGHAVTSRIKNTAYLSIFVAALETFILISLLWTVVPVISVSIERSRDVERAINHAEDASVKAEKQAKLTLNAMKQTHGIASENHKALVEISKRLDRMIDKLKINEEALVEKK